MTRIPKVVFFLNMSHNKIAIRECLKLNIVLVGCLDTNVSPIFSGFMIPINDNSVTVLYFFLRYVQRFFIICYFV